MTNPVMTNEHTRAEKVNVLRAQQNGFGPCASNVLDSEIWSKDIRVRYQKPALLS